MAGCFYVFIYVIVYNYVNVCTSHNNKPFTYLQNEELISCFGYVECFNKILYYVLNIAICIPIHILTFIYPDPHI